MDVTEITRQIHDTIRNARTAKGMPQEALAQSLGIPQPRIAELEARLRDGRPTKQVSLLLQAAAAVGLVPMFVPEEAVHAVKAAVEAAQMEPLPSVWDEVFVDLSEDHEENEQPTALAF
ncbi:helix-turn-helix domain-containing protein [Methylorubrum rhodesianum]|uniref:helix-turn-helix domain-containing protein n=1 Tax=Methylorubrum rhodesianum TaxID=29427 RepID=UPI003CFE2232